MQLVVQNEKTFLSLIISRRFDSSQKLNGSLNIRIRYVHDIKINRYGIIRSRNEEIPRIFRISIYYNATVAKMAHISLIISKYVILDEQTVSVSLILCNYQRILHFQNLFP